MWCRAPCFVPLAGVAARMPLSPVTANHAAPGCFELISHSERETRRIGAALGGLCQPGDVILLEGDLGSGKTALTQGIGQGLGVAATINSPTFTLLKEYSGHLPLYHFDLYRLDDPAQVDDLGIDDYLEGMGVSVIEWAERAEPLWPSRWLRVRLRATGAHTRRLAFDGAGPRGRAFCQAAQQALSEPDVAHGGTKHRVRDERNGEI